MGVRLCQELLEEARRCVALRVWTTISMDAIRPTLNNACLEHVSAMLDVLPESRLREKTFTASHRALPIDILAQTSHNHIALLQSHLILSA